ncbi:hypothetical protein P153DRAFT_395741 [Dothidotthia symphoricarpi CBS 119687]|uniref:Uncharacterized protein n=1 Tax=Dothidotthia symphoricarpi CBS 119687 TaxID=1392245 RepID=A0A6A6AGC8_9PLEO|nr:uncharacterized protein P153DRAFT_395741 [Dothidotthia symphoricarpi CBS 119687]KAF2130313.1 hypothetical protein P153DRAFT_395741 [Dothidotthia symphoricarpi CBS 119687]
MPPKKTPATKEDQHSKKGDGKDEVSASPATGGRTTRGQAAKATGSDSPDARPQPPLIRVGGRIAYHDFGTGTCAEIERHRKVVERNLQKKESVVLSGSDEIRNLHMKRVRLVDELKSAAAGRATKITSELKILDKRLEDNGHAVREWKAVVALYEDFMYYQNPRHRQHFLKDTAKKPTIYEETLAKSIGNIPPVKFTTDDNYNQKANPYVRGMRASRVGVTSRMRRELAPQELHMRTPVWRRRPLGVGRPLERPREPPLELALDLEQIEAKRLEIDSKPDDGTRDVEYMNHDARRIAELDLGALNVSRDRLDRLRTEGGLFISAKEDSDDWPTSFDYLSAVRDSIMAIVPAAPNHENKRKKAGGPDVLGEGESESADESDYEDFGFTRPLKPLKTDYGYEVVTKWPETRPGRKEWHTDRLLSPASAAGSSPTQSEHSVIEEVDDEDKESDHEGEESDHEDEESDYEGDLFVQSYLEGSSDVE